MKRSTKASKTNAKRTTPTNVNQSIKRQIRTTIEQLIPSSRCTKNADGTHYAVRARGPTPWGDTLYQGSLYDVQAIGGLITKICGKRLPVLDDVCERNTIETLTTVTVMGDNGLFATEMFEVWM